ncbi:hypothetical protein HK099_002457 [Clydaea vesicula]|uniref:PPM-type phosphatase domain-containing protein n=1 Tax=Clydaea vesicula TaxID=447962 RepID=A0AAD5U2F6_9FUNG|nr:hypothetical protein HK099_002457 [Clydaea vesicula]KAJ3397717.1 hypothetical protein HDU92_004133 [Lobulomyces angularis]
MHFIDKLLKQRKYSNKNNIKSTSSCQGTKFLNFSKEDTILHISSLKLHVSKKYNHTFFKDPPLKQYTNSSDIFSKFQLYAVFDGHCGQVASKFLKHRFAHHLVQTIAFIEKDYERALKDTYEQLHQILINCEIYKPESVDYASGATASVVLITNDTTYFSFLGDSPILIWRRSESEPTMLFEEHDHKNNLIKINLVDSNMFLVLIKEQMNSLVYFLLSDKEAKEKVLNGKNNVLNVEEDNLKYDDMRVGLAALNVYGSLGDSSYDPEPFNIFIDEVVEYRKAVQNNQLKKGENKNIKNIETLETNSNTFQQQSNETLLQQDQNPDDLNYDYNEFVEFVAGRPNYDVLQKHMALKKKAQPSRVLQASIKHLNIDNKIITPGLLRVPETTSIPNAELRQILIASDGVVRFYNYLGSEIRSVLMSNYKNQDRIVDELKDYLTWLRDDKSIIVVEFNNPEIEVHDVKGKIRNDGLFYLDDSRRVYQKKRKAELHQNRSNLPS